LLFILEDFDGWERAAIGMTWISRASKVFPPNELDQARNWLTE
jgi:hypothetical protein